MTDLIVPLLLVALVVVAIVAGVFAWKLHLAGTPNADLARQTGIKAAGVADALRDKILAVIAEESAKLAANATLRGVYFDAADLIADAARLPRTYSKAVSVDGRVIRAGDLPGDEYMTQPNGNVTRTKP